MAAWLALFAMAMQALWPLAAQAMQSGTQPQSVICTADGAMRAAPPGESPSPGGPFPLKHCPLCSSSSDRVGDVIAALPAVLLVPAIDDASVVPTDLALPPSRSAALALAQPRAPPPASR